MSENYDAIVIGSGQAGPFLAVKLARAGRKVALVERMHIGGTCLNDGCMPTKAMVASARIAHLARRAADFGVGVSGAVTVDMRAVKARKDELVAQSVAGLTAWMNSTDGLHIVGGHASFRSAREVQVGDRLLQAPQIFINVGGRPTVPDWPGMATVPYLTNITMMDLTVVPRHLIVIGGSYIGLEFAQMMRRFGSQVTVLEYADRIIAREDPEVSAEVQTILEREGVNFLLGVREPGVTKPGEDIVVQVSVDGRTERVVGSHLLVAVGRKPNTDDLGLDKAGVATDSRGFIVVDEWLRTNVPGIWAMGDVNGRGAFTHTAYNDHEIVVDDVLGDGKRRVADRITSYALFTDPPLGRVGQTEAEVRASGRPAYVGMMPMTRVARARERGETQGFMKVVVDAQTERILGASMLCAEGDEIVHSLLDIMAADVPYTIVARSVHIHPTVTELIPTMLSELKPLVAATMH